MPKIDAATLAEHRENVLARLVDSAEAILRADGAQALTAAAVAERAGIVRNSIYRYVDSVADLYGLVVERHLTPWLAAVARDLDGVRDPAARIHIWVAANLREAAATGHGWLMAMANTIELSPAAVASIARAHEGMGDVLRPAWEELGSPTPAVHEALTRALLDTGFRLVDTATKVDVTIAAVLGAVDALVASVRDA